MSFSYPNIKITQTQENVILYTIILHKHRHKKFSIKYIHTKFKNTSKNIQYNQVGFIQEIQGQFHILINNHNAPQKTNRLKSNQNKTKQQN